MNYIINLEQQKTKAENDGLVFRAEWEDISEIAKNLQKKNIELEKALNSFNPVCDCQCCKDVERFKDDYSMR